MTDIPQFNSDMTPPEPKPAPQNVSVSDTGGVQVCDTKSPLYQAHEWSTAQEWGSTPPDDRKKPEASAPPPPKKHDIPQFTVSPDQEIVSDMTRFESPRDRLIREMSVKVMDVYSPKSHSGVWIENRLKGVRNHANALYPQE